MKNGENILASCSDDETIRVWDIASVWRQNDLKIDKIKWNHRISFLCHWMKREILYFHHLRLSLCCCFKIFDFVFCFSLWSINGLGIIKYNIHVNNWSLFKLMSLQSIIKNLNFLMTLCWKNNASNKSNFEL